MAEEKEAFLERWSRRKKEDRVADEPAPPAEQKGPPPAPLPPVDKLTPESDFKPFMDPRVDLETRRSALKKLFADAHFNIPDAFEPYSGDLTAEDPISPEMLKNLNQARKLLFDEPEKTSQAAAETEAQPELPPQEAKDVAGKKDA